MAHQIPLHGGRLISEIITDIHIHIYLGKELTFVNTIIVQLRNLIALNVGPVIHVDPHPQNAIGACPFAIINGKYVKEKDEIYKLLRMLIDTTSHARNLAEAEEPERINQHSYALTAFLQMCEELSEVATVLNEDDINPFYLFLNPILKYREHEKLEKLKAKLLINSQFLTPDAKLNADYFIYKLHILEEYYKQLQRKRLSIVQGKFVKICVIALLKHFAANCKNILEVALHQEQFQKINSRMIQHLTDLQDYHQRLIEEGREVVGAYATFSIESRAQEKKPEEVEPFHQKLTKSLIKPAAVTLVFLTLYRIFSN